MQILLEPPPSPFECLPAPAEGGEHTELYRMAFAACPSGFIVWDSGSRIVDWNPAAERIFGWTRAEAMAQPGPHFLTPQDVWPAVEGVFARLLEAEEPTDNLNDNVTRDGRVIHCEWHNIPMRDRQERVSGFVSMVQDVTPRKQEEAALQNEIAERKRAELEMERVLTQSEQIIGSITSILITIDENSLVTTWNAAAALERRRRRRLRPADVGGAGTALHGLRHRVGLGCHPGRGGAMHGAAETGAAGRHPLCDP